MVNSGFLKLKETASVSFRVLKLVWKIDSKLLIISLVAILIPAVIPFINIYIYKLVIDLIVSIVSGNTEFDPFKFYPLIAFRLLTYFVQDIAFRTQNLVERLLWTKVPIELNQIIFKKYADLDIHYFEDDKFRDLLERVRQSYDFKTQQLVSNLLYSFQSILQVTIALVALINLNWIFVILILIVAIPEFLLETYRSKLAFGIWYAESPYRKRYNYLLRMLEGHREVKEVKIFRLAKEFMKELKKLQLTFYNSNKGLALKDYKYGAGVNALSTLVLVGIEVYVIVQALQRKVSVGDINFYTGVVSNFQNGLGGLMRNITQIFDQSLYVKSMFELLDSKPVVVFPENGVKLDPAKPPLIEFKEVSFSYPNSKTKILNNFSMLIKPGEKVAFVGENGAGKSTIIKLLVRFYDVTEGEILLDGVNIKDIDKEDLYSLLGVLFQDFNRYEDTAKENIRYGKIEVQEDLEKIIQASVSAGSHELISKYEKGYEQMLGKMFEGGIDLSGGQWQKIALARAFFRNAPVLILDEPTSAIDAKGESEIFGRVEKLSRNKTVIIISHRFSTVRNADKIYVIDDGRIKESGSHSELMEENGTYAKLFKLQAKGYL